MILTEAADRPKPPISAGVGLPGSWRPGTLTELSIAAR